MQRMSDPPITSPRAHDKVRAYMRLASPALSNDELLDVADMIHDIIRRRRGMDEATRTDITRLRSQA